MKRVSHLFEKIISDENLMIAISDVNKSHRWLAPGKPNRKVLYIETHFDEHVKMLKDIIINGFEPHEPSTKERWDPNAKKYRIIREPLLWPDQYVHHALIQVLEPVLMRGMDPWCCGSIKGRGAIYGVNAIKKWMKEESKPNQKHSGPKYSSTHYCAELDIHHFYDSLKPEIVMDRMRQLIKDYRTLDLIERVMKYNITIGAYFSQWFANTTLQPLDHLIRESGLSITHYIRYIDNFTIFSNKKRDIQNVIKLVKKWLEKHSLELNENYQWFDTNKRLPNALGYRYGHGYTLIRKGALLNLKRQIAEYEKKKAAGKPIPIKMAYSLISRIGRLKHCNSYQIQKKYIRKGLMKELKDIIRKHNKEHNYTWQMAINDYLAEQNTKEVNNNGI